MEMRSSREAFYRRHYYFDELLRRQRETDVGCHVGHMSYAAFGCADDLLLLIPSIHGLEMLIKTSESVASE